MKTFVDKVVDAYIECGLWADAEDADISEVDSLDIARIREDCIDFCAAANAGSLLAGLSPEQVGHDFYLTRCGHGAGFWDRGLGEQGDKLTDLAESFGSDDTFALLSYE